MPSSLAVLVGDGQLERGLRGLRLAAHGVGTLAEHILLAGQNEASRGRALLASLAEDGPLAVLAASQQRLAVVLWRHALLGGLTPGQDGLHLQGLLRLKAHPQRCFALRARDQFDSLILRVLHFEDDAAIGAFYALYFHSRLFRYIACQYQRRPRRPRRPRRGWGRRSPSRDPRSRKPVGGWDPSCPRRWPY